VSNKYPLALHTLSSHEQAMTRVKLCDRAIIVFLIGFHDLILLRCFLIWSFNCLQLIEIARKANWNWLKWVGLSKKWFGLGQIGRLAANCRPICQLSPIGTFWSNWRQFADWPGRKIGWLGRPIWRPILFGQLADWPPILLWQPDLSSSATS